MWCESDRAILYPRGLLPVASSRRSHSRTLPPEDRALFEALDLGVATLSPEELGPALPEPHPSWMVRAEEDWAKRYGAGR